MSITQCRPRSHAATAALALAASALTGACSRMEEDKQLVVEGVTYTFPASHIKGFINPGEGLPYANIRPAGQEFDIIYDYRAKYKRNYSGSSTPLVVTVNDHPSPTSFQQIDFPGGVTICRDDHPGYGCGLRIEDEVAAWSVVFNNDQAPNSEAIRSLATEALKRYRS